MKKIDYLLEEYKALRHEIDQNQRDSHNIIQLGLTITATILGLAYSQFVGDHQWILLFVPCYILTPLSFLIAQRSRATWRIGRYIQKYIEPELGLKWESITIKYCQKRRKGMGDLWGIASFVGSSMMSLIFIQLLCPLLSYITIFIAKRNYAVIWWFVLSILAGISIIIQCRILFEANHQDKYSIEK